MFEVLGNNNSHVKDFLQSLTVSTPVTALFLDLFCHSALEVAESIGIRSYFFFTSNAAALALFVNFPVFDKIIGKDSFRNLGTTLFEIPGLFSVPGRDMIEPMLDRGMSYDECINMSAHLIKSHGIMANTFESLEPRAVKVLNDGTCLPGFSIPPVYCVGPLIAKRGEDGGREGGERNECLSWLDSVTES